MTPSGSDALVIAEAGDADIPGLVALWQAAGVARPWNDPALDIVFARAQPNSAVLVGRVAGAVAASVMVGHDGHRGAVYYVAVDPAHERKGFGSAMMAAAEAWLKARGVWKLNLLVREGNPVEGFYQRLGFAVAPRVAMEKWLDETRKPKG